MPLLKFWDPASQTYKDIYGLPGPPGPAGPAGTSGGASSGVFGTAPLDVYGTDSLSGQETYTDSAGKLRTRPQLIPTNAVIDITAPPEAYPVGMSIMSMSAVDATAKGWPASGTVITYRRSSGDKVAAQYFYQNHTPQAGAPFMQYRSGNGANTPAWSAWLTQYGTSTEKPYAGVRRTVVAQSFATAVTQLVTWEISDYADGMAWDAAQNGFIIPISGYYTVEASVHFATGGATGNRVILLYQNGAIVAAVQTGASSAGGTSPFISRTHWFNAGDVARIYAGQGSGGTVLLTTSSAYNWFTITKVPSPLPAGAQFGEQIYSASRRHAAATSIPNNAWTSVPFDTEVYTDGVVWGTPTATTFNVPVDGYYQVDAGAQFSGNATGYRGIGIYLDANAMSATTEPGNGASSASYTASTTIKATAGQYITVRVWQNSGAGLTLSGGVTGNWCTVTKVPAPVVGGNAASGVWGIGNLASLGTDSLIGREVYADSRGQLRAAPSLLPIKLAADLPDKYPMGISVVAMTNTENSAGGWPGGSQYSTVTTSKGGIGAAGFATQQWSRFTTDPKLQQIYTRTGNVGSGWTTWQEVMGPDTGWIGLAYDPDWTDYGVGTYGPGEYRKVGNRVELRGLVKTTVLKTATNVIATLPVGFRPVYNEIFNQNASMQLITGAASTGTAHTHTTAYQQGTRVDISAVGVLNTTLSSVTNILANAYLSLAGIFFYTS